MDISKFLSKVLGIYLIVVSIAIFFNGDQFTIYIKELLKNAPLMLVMGFWTFIIGLLMVVSHNIWQWSWRLLVTIISWLILLKGVSIIFYPHYIDLASLLFIQNKNIAYTTAGFDLIMGMILCYLGFKRN
ncbi:hypothetical protein OQJ18_10280 [Fluoribacter dumoffii]|uniref:Integral membrane protein (PIN domain superfamily) n=1 Tax=Fluoribacter dumoffii TaxID=463 RepID=A0A377G6H0_9GAMM|nr:hypothetical protein [Fluoribacter dumoffii]KTC92405.1 Integral membrane protein (PIN domain superfamily) [Fluoribacter dumoffii NY 23]MCW8386981.1 hypothetical protein [Fluoribacter dumoffii]MCW8417516.1 hypothetical protein [Fluoribacter dumoffii]MCW8454642.1 hypothetical protein [Fluoribacter dumoffii]MCW8461280.1 hypothetical protein [Fluoribacter dumoffii]